MKKLIITALIAFSTIAASAQMMTSRTLMKRHSPTTWYVRAGISANMLTGMSSYDKESMWGEKTSTGSKAGFEVDFGFNKGIGRSGAYWGMELGVGNRGGNVITEYEDGKSKTSINAWSLKYSPITFGYKYSLTDDIKLDAHLGAFALVDMSRKAKEDDGDDIDADEAFENRFDAGIQVGVGAWYKKFNLDITYQQGFVPFVRMPNGSLKSGQVLIRLGYAF